ncbi:hypothetical protein Cgig2_030872 [Carnegiea gigantea]|uniref:Uncharacterized protein n=1 Tax=Carnegiea gigantea TaxID=171969 RepID=A0A9Q1KGJ2_9CARY|nr:hypothetical protein Cgig2_030872 [Carnegiea gigantea]
MKKKKKKGERGRWLFWTLEFCFPAAEVLNVNVNQLEEKASHFCSGYMFRSYFVNCFEAAKAMDSVWDCVTDYDALNCGGNAIYHRQGTKITDIIGRMYNHLLSTGPWCNELTFGITGLPLSLFIIIYSDAGVFNGPNFDWIGPRWKDRLREKVRTEDWRELEPDRDWTKKLGPDGGRPKQTEFIFNLSSVWIGELNRTEDLIRYFIGQVFLFYGFGLYTYTPRAPLLRGLDRNPLCNISLDLLNDLPIGFVDVCFHLLLGLLSISFVALLPELAHLEVICSMSKTQGLTCQEHDHMEMGWVGASTLHCSSVSSLSVAAKTKLVGLV